MSPRPSPVRLTRLLLAACLLVVSAEGSNGRLPGRDIGEKPYLSELRTDNFSSLILGLDIANGSDLAAAALSDLRVRVWRLDSGEVVHEMSLQEPATDPRLKLPGDLEPVRIRFSPDGRTLAVSFLSRIYLYDVEAWHLQKSLGVAGEDDPRDDLLHWMELKRRSAEEAQASRIPPEPTLDGTMKEHALKIQRGDGRTRITAFAFANEGESLIVAYCRGGCYVSGGLRQWVWPTGNDPVRLWDIRSGQITWERAYDSEGIITRAVPSPDGRHFAAANSLPGHCAVGIYDLSDGHIVSSHAPGPCSEAPSIVFIQEGRAYITNRIDEAERKNKRWREAAIYEAGTSRKIADLPGLEGARDADISPDGRWLATVTWFGLRFQISDLTNRKIVVTESPKEWKRKRYPLVDRVRFSPDGRWLLVGRDDLKVGSLAVYQFGSSWPKVEAIH